MTDTPSSGNHDHPESPPSASEPRVRGSHHGLLVAAAVLLTITGLLASGYGISAKLPSLVVLSLQSLLAAAACWMTLNAERLRTAWTDARRSIDEAAQPKPGRTAGGWLRGEARDDQPTYSAVLGESNTDGGCTGCSSPCFPWQFSPG